MQVEQNPSLLGLATGDAGSRKGCPVVMAICPDESLLYGRLLFLTLPETLLKLRQLLAVRRAFDDDNVFVAPLDADQSFARFIDAARGVVARFMLELIAMFTAFGVGRKEFFGVICGVPRRILNERRSARRFVFVKRVAVAAPAGGGGARGKLRQKFAED